MKALKTSALLKPLSLFDLLKRPELSFPKIKKVYFNEEEDPEVYEAVEIKIKYEGYIKREQDFIKSIEEMENLLLKGMNYPSIRGLSSEEKEKLEFVKPRTLGQARRISGVNPSAIQALFVHLKTRDLKNKFLKN